MVTCETTATSWGIHVGQGQRSCRSSGVSVASTGEDAASPVMLQGRWSGSSGGPRSYWGKKWNGKEEMIVELIRENRACPRGDRIFGPSVRVGQCFSDKYGGNVNRLLEVWWSRFLGSAPFSPFFILV
jgi:hypothetical protein